MSEMRGLMSEDVELCSSERQEDGTAVRCLLPVRHEGPHWTIVPGSIPPALAWNGDDRDWN